MRKSPFPVKSLAAFLTLLTGVHPMRMDILFSWPPVFAVSLASAWLGIRNFTKRKSKVPKKSKSPAARPFGADLHWGSLFYVACVVVAPRVTIAADDKPAVLSQVAEHVLAWFPDDSETLVAASSFRLQATQKFEPGLNDFAAFAQRLAYGELADLEKGKYLKPLIDKKVAMAMRAGRHFEGVSAFGSHRSEGCTIVVFEKDLGEAGKDWTDLLRQGAKEVRMVRGREVFTFPSTVEMEGVVKLKPWQGTYLVLLTPETLLCATSDVYLEELLKRVDTRPAGRALPSSLAEWKHIDPSAPAWMIRHIRGAKDKRIIDGVTWSLKMDQVNIEYLPVDNAVDDVETQARKRWQPAGMDLKTEFTRSADGSVIVSLNTIGTNPDLFLVKLFIYALQNESGAVGAK